MNCPQCQRVMVASNNMFLCNYCGYQDINPAGQTTTPITPISVAVIDNTTAGP